MTRATYLGDGVTTTFLRPTPPAGPQVTVNGAALSLQSSNSTSVTFQTAPPVGSIIFVEEDLLGSGGGSSTLAGLADKATFDLVSVNTALSNALAVAYSSGLSLYNALKGAGVTFDGVTNDAAAFQSGINGWALSATTSKFGVIPSVDPLTGAALKLKINSGITINTSADSIAWNGIYIDASGMTSGYAVTFAGSAGGSHYSGTEPLQVSGFVLNGPAYEASNVDGVFIGGANNVGQIDFSRFSIQGFRDGMVFGSNAYISNFYGVRVFNCYRYGITSVSATNAGESMNFFGCSVNECVNSTGTAIALYFPSTIPGFDVRFNGSLSYNDVAFDVGGGQMWLDHTHIEQKKSNNPIGYFSTTSGRPTSSFVVTGGQWVHGVLGTGTEASIGRAHFMVVRSNSGDRGMVSIRGLTYQGFGKSGTELVHHDGAGMVEISIEDLNNVQQGNLLGQVCNATSLIYNGSFESGKTAGWTFSDGTATVTQDTVQVTASEGILAAALSVSGGTGGTGYSAATIGVCSGGSIVGGQAVFIPTISSGAITGWTRVFGGAYTPGGTPPTFTITDTGGGSGASAATVALDATKRSLKIVSGSSNSTAYSQTFGVRPGRKVHVRGFLRGDVVTSGTLDMKIYFYAQDGTQISSFTLKSLNAVQAAFALYGNVYRVPRGAATAKVSLESNSFVGTGYFSDIQAWIV